MSSNHLKSFEQLLKNKKCTQKFREFLESEYSGENLEFYEAVVGFKKSSDQISSAKVIYDTFIAVGSSREVNIDSLTRNAIKEKLESDGFDLEMFDQAQEKIYSLMARDSFPRFLQSSQYKGML